MVRFPAAGWLSLPLAAAVFFPLLLLCFFPFAAAGFPLWPAGLAARPGSRNRLQGRALTFKPRLLLLAPRLVGHCFSDAVCGLVMI